MIKLKLVDLLKKMASNVKINIIKNNALNTTYIVRNKEVQYFFDNVYSKEYNNYIVDKIYLSRNKILTISVLEGGNSCYGKMY